MFFKKTKKYLNIIVIIISLFISIEVNAQYPVYIWDSNPYIKFWVTTDPTSNEYPTTLKVKDEDLVEILGKIASTTESLYAETLRNNYWMLYNEETRNEKEQSLSKYKALKLQNLIEENILSWVNEGFNTDKDGKNGKPAYIEDEANFFYEMEIKIKDDFKRYLDIYYQYAPEDEKNYLDKIKKILASMTDAPLTEDDYYANNDNSGPFSQETIVDWSSWLSINLNEYTNPNQAFLNARSFMNDLINSEKEKYIKEIENGNGFLSFKRCQIKYFTMDGNPDGEGETYYGDPYYIKSEDMWEKGLPEYDYPIVSCTTIIPGYLIAEQVSDIYRSKYDFIKETAISTNGNDLVLDSIEKDLKDFQTKIMKVGVIGRDSSVKNDDLYSELNDAIEKASEELKGRDGGNTKISEDTDDPRNTNSRFYPKNFLTDEKWKEIWDFKQNENNDWYGWFDFLYDWYEDDWVWDE